MALVGFVLSAVSLGGAEWLLSTANTEPDGGRWLRRFAVEGGPSGRPAGHVALVLIDGLRVDEARALPSLASSSPAVLATLALPTPTLSRPFYHLLFTGVPPDASGVRTNRFAARARHDSVVDRVRAAGGRVFIVADGLDWMRRMYGRRSDGGSDALGSLDAPLEDVLVAWRAAPAPSLLIVHSIAVDRTAHAAGIHSRRHRAALADADAVIRRVLAARPAAVLVLSDHGHLEAGGHGGPEPEVRHAPLWVRVPGLEPGTVEAPIAAERLAATLASWLGVARPFSAVGRPVRRLLPGEPVRSSVEPIAGSESDPWYSRAAALVDAGRLASGGRLSARRRWLLPLALVLALASLGPIKRAFAFDRAVPLAMLLWLAFVILGHVASGRPLTLSAIDEQWAHVLRVTLLSGAACVATLMVSVPLARGDLVRRLRRTAATIGWTAWTSALVVTAWIGGALGPWPLSSLEFYLPLLLAGAAASTVALAAMILAATALARTRR